MDNANVKGLSVVKTIVTNKDVGNKTFSDFNVNINTNYPIPISFIGNSRGTNIKLGPGMHSVSQSDFSGSATSYSCNCFGVIMVAVTKTCTITNNYDNPSSSMK